MEGGECTGVLPIALIITAEPVYRTRKLSKKCGSVTCAVFPLVGTGIYSSTTVHGSKVLTSAVERTISLLAVEAPIDRPSRRF